MAKICKKAVVYGKVQGVFFRGTTQAKARSLGISGFAKNHHDLTVEVVMCGDPESLELLTDWLHEGPVNSRVDKVNVVPFEQADFTDFEVL